MHLAGGEVRVVDELHISEIRAISRSQCWLGDRQAYTLRFYLTRAGRKGLE